ncbi:MAG: hypothetical protein AB8B73_09595 [Ekhidna sp.]
MSLENNLDWWVILIAVGLLLLLIYLDYKSRPKRLRGARFAALFLIVISLLALYLVPYQTSSATAVKITWETENANTERIDSLKKEGFILIQNLKEYDELVRSKVVDQFVVIGEGLEKWELSEISQLDTFLPSISKKEGVLDFTMTDALEQSEMTFTFQLKMDSGLSVVLSGSGIESTTEYADQPVLQLNTIPSVTGYLTYQLDGIRKGDTVFSEVIPLYVKPKQKNNVLMLANTPSFEFRGLKNYLAETGFGIAERLKVSTDLYHQAFTNLGERRLTNLSSRLLDDFQLIIADASAYESLTKSEQQRIKERIEKGELGLVIMGAKATINLVSWQSRNEKSFLLEGKNGEIELNDSDWQLRGEVDIISFNDNMVAQIQSLGLGQMVRPLFTDSFVLNLQGERKLYSKLWQSILADVIGMTPVQSTMETARFPRVNEPTDVQVANDELEELKIEDVRLAVSQQWFSPTNWEMTFWPAKRGWQKVMVDGASFDQFFAFDSADWVLQKREMKRKQTETYVGKGQGRERNIPPNKEPVSKWIFFAIFLFSISFLWVEQRLG